MKWFLTSLIFITGIQALTLKEAEEIALSQNPQVKAAQELLEMARQGRMEAISQWLPEISLLSQGFRTEKPITLLKLNKPSAFLTQLTMTQIIFSSELVHQIKISSLMIDQFTKLLEAAKNDVLYQIRTLYYLIALDHQKVKTIQEHLHLLQFLADRVERRERIGESTLYHVNQARVAMANVTDTYFQAQKALKNHQDQLIQALGFDPSDSSIEFLQNDLDIDSYPELKEKIAVAEDLFQEGNIIQSTFICLERDLMKEIFSKEEFSRWNLIAQQLRPDLRLTQTYNRIAKENIRLKRSEYWPALSLIGKYGGATPYSFHPSTHFSNQQFQWSVGFSISWTLFDGMRRSHRIKKAQAEARAVQQQTRKVAQEAQTEVRDQLYEMEQALAKYLSSSANYKLSKQTLEQAKSQLEIGYVTIYDYLISVDGHIRAKTAVDEGKYALLASYFGLLHATGKDCR